MKNTIQIAWVRDGLVVAGVAAPGRARGAPRPARASLPQERQVRSPVRLWRLACLLLAGCLDAAPLAAGEFRAAVVKIDITPETPQMLRGYSPRMSTKVLDRLHHRILALDDGASSFYLISSDLCSISPAFSDQVTGDLARQLGVEPQNVWWSITHTHSSPYVGPPGVPGALMPNRFQFQADTDYTAMVVKTLTDGAREAKRSLVPAKLGAGWGFSQANINRRAKDVDGKIKLGMNPQGPTDRRIGLLRLEQTDSRPLALLANYAMHATVLGERSTVVSGDAPGVVAEYVERKIGSPMLYLNGAAGNLAPLYSVGDAKFLSQFNVLLGDPILEANRILDRTSASVRLKTSLLHVQTAKRVSLQWPVELRAYLNAAKPGEEKLRIPIRFLQINDDILIWSAPLELFCEISNEIRDRSPFPYTFYVGYTNGSFAYLPTAAEFAAGGYEAKTSPFTPSAAGDLTAAVVDHIRDHATRR